MCLLGRQLYYNWGDAEKSCIATGVIGAGDTAGVGVSSPVRVINRVGGQVQLEGWGHLSVGQLYCS